MGKNKIINNYVAVGMLMYFVGFMLPDSLHLVKFMLYVGAIVFDVIGIIHYRKKC